VTPTRHAPLPRPHTDDRNLVSAHASGKRMLPTEPGGETAARSSTSRPRLWPGRRLVHGLCANAAGAETGIRAKEFLHGNKDCVLRLTAPSEPRRRECQRGRPPENRSNTSTKSRTARPFLASRLSRAAHQPAGHDRLPAEHRPPYRADCAVRALADSLAAAAAARRSCWRPAHLQQQPVPPPNSIVDYGDCPNNNITSANDRQSEYHSKVN
jgi:hypothetical protein